MTLAYDRAGWPAGRDDRDLPQHKAGPCPALCLKGLQRRRWLVFAAALPLAACSPRLNWRELRPAGARCVIALPDKPQTAQRELDVSGHKVTMTMTSTGVGASLFALGVADLPAPLLAPAQLDATLAWFRDGLLRNVQGAAQGTPAAVQAARLAVPPGRLLRAAQAVQAQGRVAGGRSTRLAARFFVVDDRLYQLVALAAEGEIGADALDTFFDSFRLID